MWLLKVPRAMVTVGGIALALYATFMLLNAPVFDADPLNSKMQLAMGVAFIVGTVAASWGMLKFADIGTRM